MGEGTEKSVVEGRNVWRTNGTFSSEWNIRRFAREAERDNPMRGLKVSPLVSNGIATRFQFHLNNDFHLSLPTPGKSFSNGNRVDYSIDVGNVNKLNKDFTLNRRPNPT